MGLFSKSAPAPPPAAESLNQACKDLTGYHIPYLGQFLPPTAVRKANSRSPSASASGRVVKHYSAAATPPHSHVRCPLVE